MQMSSILQLICINCNHLYIVLHDIQYILGTWDLCRQLKYTVSQLIFFLQSFVASATAVFVVYFPFFEVVDAYYICYKFAHIYELI